MQFQPTTIEGGPLILLDSISDERGFFARTFCEREFASQGLAQRFVQANMSHNLYKGTVRGLHMQVAPHEESKLVRCIRGAVFDVVVDLRPSSATYLSWYGTELSAANRHSLYVPQGCAHGFQTMCDDSEILYLVSAFYAPESERGYRFDDPAFNIRWPFEPTSISEKDRNWPAYDDSKDVTS